MELATINATKQECNFWLARLFAHYPARDSARDAVVISDLTAALIENKAALVALCHVCDELWQETTKDNPWPAPSGVILRRVIEKTRYWRKEKNRLTKPNSAPPSQQARQEEKGDYMGRVWQDFTEEDKQKYIEITAGMTEKLKRFYDYSVGKKPTVDVEA